MKDFCVYDDYTLKEAIECIELNKNRAVLVINKDEKVIGVISQGDIIRALLNGKSLFTQIKTIVRPNFFYLTEKDMKEAYKLFRKYHITLLPIVDEDFHLSDYISMADIYKYMEEL